MTHSVQMNGFKETEIGEIPAEWTLTGLGVAAELVMGQSPPSSSYNETGQGIPFLQGKAEFGTVFPTPTKWCTEPKKIVHAGTVLISVRAPVGDVNLSPGEVCVGRGLAGIFGRSTLDNHFLFYYLQFAKPRLESEGTGSTFKSINKTTLNSFLIPLPPLPEQRRIAAALSAIQRAIAAQDDVIAAAKELKRSLMQRLFTYGPGQEPAETKETEIGEIPAHWEVRTIGEICDASDGLVQTGPFGSQLHASDYVEEGIPTIMPRDIVDSRIVTAEIARISPKDHQRLAKYHLQAGDIVYARRGDIGRRALVTEKEAGWLCGTGSLFIRTNSPEIDPLYLHYYLGRPEVNKFVLAQAIGTTMINLNTKILRSVPVAFPEKGKQEQISDMLAAVDAKITAEEDRKAALQELFRSALHQLMTGQIRLSSDERIRATDT